MSELNICFAYKIVSCLLSISNHHSKNQMNKIRSYALFSYVRSAVCEILWYRQKNKDPDTFMLGIYGRFASIFCKSPFKLVTHPHTHTQVAREYFSLQNYIRRNIFQYGFETDYYPLDFNRLLAILTNCRQFYTNIFKYKS